MDQVTPVADAVTTASNTINSILTMSSSGVILKLVLLGATVLFTIWMSLRKTSAEIKTARKEEGHDDQVNHNQAVEQNKKDNQQVSDDSKRIDDLLTGEKK